MLSHDVHRGFSLVLAFETNSFVFSFSISLSLSLSLKLGRTVTHPGLEGCLCMAVSVCVSSAFGRERESCLLPGYAGSCHCSREQGWESWSQSRM